MSKDKKTRIRSHGPRIALLLESSHEISRGMIRGIFKYARIYGDWLIDIVAGGPGDQRLPNPRYWKGNGIIGRISNDRLARDVVRSGIPLVIIDPIDEYLDPKHPLFQCSTVRCNSESVGQIAAQYFMNLGFDHYAFIGEINDINWSVIRRDTFRKTVEDSGFQCSVYPTPSDQNREWIFERKKMGKWLQKLPKPVAIFVANDHRARQVLECCSFYDIPVPYQASVLGVNNDELICQSTIPSLSSIPLDSEGAGYAAAEMLSAIMSEKGFDEKKTVEFFPLPVVSRGSTGNVALQNPNVIKAVEFIRINAGLNIRVSDVVSYLKISRQWLEKIFQKERGRTVFEEIQHVRMKTIRSLVVETDLPFNEIAFQCGFEGGNHLAILFKKNFGITMSEYREQERKLKDKL